MEALDANPHIDSEIPTQIFTAAGDLRWLLDKGYNKKSSIQLVGNRYNLNGKQRHILFRGVFPYREASERKKKILPLEEIEGKRLTVDGYNVLISVETALKNDLFVLSDDGMLRDVSGVFGSYRMNEDTQRALEFILSIIKRQNPRWVGFYYDSPISKSGELARKTEDMMGEYGINGEGKTAKIVGRELLKNGEIIATSDSILIDKAEEVVDIPANILQNHFRDAAIISLLEKKYLKGRGEIS